MLCPRCDHQGCIYKLRINELDKIVYWCDECDGTWEDPSKILLYGKKYEGEFEDFEIYLQNHGLTYMKTPITNLGADWDKTVLADDSLVFCPLCGVKGIICRANVTALNTIVYYCDVCRAMWKQPELIGKEKHEFLLDFLKKHNLDLSTAHLEDFSYTWNK